jgi:hypothetical protein
VIQEEKATMTRMLNGVKINAAEAVSPRSGVILAIPQSSSLPLSCLKLKIDSRVWNRCVLWKL